VLIAHPPDQSGAGPTPWPAPEIVPPGASCGSAAGLSNVAGGGGVEEEGRGGDASPPAPPVLGVGAGASELRCLRRIASSLLGCSVRRTRVLLVVFFRALPTAP
jgi:hypothetical protein